MILSVVIGSLAMTDLTSRDFTASAINDDELIYSPQQDFCFYLFFVSRLYRCQRSALSSLMKSWRSIAAVLLNLAPPDVLVIGSSRALRGVEFQPALRQALDASGYDGLSIFNFGVNGATAQVVDLIVRRPHSAGSATSAHCVGRWRTGVQQRTSGRDV